MPNANNSPSIADLMASLASQDTLATSLTDVLGEDLSDFAKSLAGFKSQLLNLMSGEPKANLTTFINMYAERHPGSSGALASLLKDDAKVDQVLALLTSAN